MQSLINFRDFGGVADVRADRLYRCGHLAKASPAAMAHLAGLNFATIADLRYSSERLAEASPWPGGWAERILCHDEDRGHDAPHLAMLRSGTLTVEGVDGFYLDLYRTLPFAPPYRRLFAETLRNIADREGRTLIHCTAGKDRTGMLCALLLALLGVPREAILADYMRSSGAPGLKAMVPGILRRIRERHGHELDPAAVEALVDVKPAYLAATFDAIEQAEGSVEAYAAAGGVDAATVQRLRAALLD